MLAFTEAVKQALRAEASLLYNVAADLGAIWGGWHADSGLRMPARIPALAVALTEAIMLVAASGNTHACRVWLLSWPPFSGEAGMLLAAVGCDLPGLPTDSMSAGGMSAGVTELRHGFGGSQPRHTGKLGPWVATL